jgi:hypothetical protein
MKKLLVLIPFLIASTAHANLQGNWLGWGEWKYEGSGTPCHTVNFSFTESATALQRNTGKFDCEMIFMDIPGLSLEKSGSQLLLEKTVVGDFSDSHYHWVEPYNQNVGVEVTIDRSANHLDYHERWIENNGHLLYEINARLFLTE